MRQLVLYIHGKGGNAMEADHYKTLFAGDVNAELTIMQNVEHWFHTEKQMTFLDDWIRGLLK